MEQGKHTEAAKNFFLYFLLFALLYTIAINFGGMLFDLIDKAFPISGEFYTYFSQGSLRFHLSVLIIGTPIFLMLARFIHRASEKSEVMRANGLRRWLTYITLLVTTLVVIGDLIALVNNLLGGETTARFVLKSLVVLIIAGAILYYYFKDVKAQREGAVIKAPLSTLYFVGTIIVVLAAIIAGIFAIESPAVQRQRNNDQDRVNDLQQIEYAIQSQAYIDGALPVSLDTILLQSNVASDPVSGQPYEYRMIDQNRYELCATFETSILEMQDEASYYYDNRWLHDEGRKCFERRAELSNGSGKEVAPGPSR